MAKKKHTKTTDSILSRIYELKDKRAQIDSELAELADLLSDTQWRINYAVSDVKKTSNIDVFA